MVFGGLFSKGEKNASFRCVYDECKSLCCHDNLVVLNEEDVRLFQEQGIDLDDSTKRMDLNDFLVGLGQKGMSQLVGLEILRLKKKESGDCLFLDQRTGVCEIYDARPFHCREFPFKFGKKGIMKKDLICPGLGRGDEKEIDLLKEELGLKGSVHGAPYLLGDEQKLKTSKRLMGIVFRLLR